MKYVEEFRDPARVRRLAREIGATATRPWTIMEVCGGQTHTIARYGIEDLLPAGIELVHGPGCPVCVTPLEVIEAARQVAMTPGTILCSFGDMLRVPGMHGDLLQARARGADVRVVVSPLDGVRLAVETPDRYVVFFGVGFETTAPTTAMAAELADRLGLSNFGLLASHVRVPPAMELLLAAPGCRVQAFLAAGHVCTVEGTAAYPPIAARFGAPIVVTGFEPVDLLEGLLMAIRQLEQGRGEVEVQYARCVQAEGNPVARAAVERVYEVADVPWRGIGVVPDGGLRLRADYVGLDPVRRLGLALAPCPEPAACRAADVLQGKLKPAACPAFGEACTPEHPLGAPMVSSEGACAAHYRWRRHPGSSRGALPTPRGA